MIRLMIFYLASAVICLILGVLIDSNLKNNTDILLALSLIFGEIAILIYHLNLRSILTIRNFFIYLAIPISYIAGFLISLRLNDLYCAKSECELDAIGGFITLPITWITLCIIFTIIFQIFLKFINRREIYKK